MGPFSDDGQWWWNGTQWVATSQIVLPDLPPTDFERSGKLQEARIRMRESRWLWWSAFLVAFPWFYPEPFQAYRSWRLEQLALATASLLGDGEPMLAGEAAVAPAFPATLVMDELAVVVTASHVLILVFDRADGQTRRVAMAAPARDVDIEVRPAVSFLYPALVVHGARGRWVIKGLPTVFKPEPVVDAWRKSAKRSVAAE